MSISKKFGFILKKERELAGLSQERLAELAGVSAKYLSRLEQGHVNATIGSLTKITTTLGLELKFVPSSLPNKPSEKLDELQRTIGYLNSQATELVLEMSKAILRWQKNLKRPIKKEDSFELSHLELKDIELRIKEVMKKIQAQGNTDSLENHLDCLEKQVSLLSKKGHAKENIQYLKNLLDEVK